MERGSSTQISTKALRFPAKLIWTENGNLFQNLCHKPWIYGRRLCRPCLGWVSQRRDILENLRLFHPLSRISLGAIGLFSAYRRVLAQLMRMQASLEKNAGAQSAIPPKIQSSHGVTQSFQHSRCWGKQKRQGKWKKGTGKVEGITTNATDPDSAKLLRWCARCGVSPLLRVRRLKPGQEDA